MANSSKKISKRATKKTGRPTSYSDKLADKFCDYLMRGWSVHQICKEPGMPTQDTIYRWLGSKEEFSEKYAHAREVGAYSFFDRMLEIAEDDSKDVIKNKEVAVAIHTTS